MVLSLATAAFAVEVSYEGKAAVEWSGESQGDDKVKPGFAEAAKEAKVTVDFTKDYGDGVSAGVTTIVEAHADGDLDFDSDGWIQLERDLFTAKASTEIDGGVGRDFGEFNIPGAAGVGLDLNLIEGLTINTIVNAGPDYNFLLKGEYADDLFTVGGGFQNDTDNKKSAIGIYGTANLIDGLTLAGEFGSRNLDTEDKDLDAITSILVTAAYELDALNAKAGLLMNDIGFASLNDDDADQEWRLNENIRFSGGGDVMVIFAEASYDLTDDLYVDGNFDMLLSCKDADGNDVLKDMDKEYKFSYKIGAGYTLDALTLEGWYKVYADKQVGGKANYNLADGVDASFEVTSTKYLDVDASLLAYTAKIEAAF
jgi:hypothetical protein